ncbi:MAG: 4Fe-4S single cluster domain-containing protein [Thermodesulfobacteriota bacterium]
MKIILNLHALIPSTRVNGPGIRSVVFFQGCARRCTGCFNTATHDFSPNKSMDVNDVLSHLPSGAEGLTISGGEPFSQPRGLEALLKGARERPELSTVVYTGFTMDEIEANESMSRILPLIDVLIAGPYDYLRPEKTGLARGSANQTFHFLSSRYTIDDFYLPARLEVSIGSDGSVTGTGFAGLPAPVENI